MSIRIEISRAQLDDLAIVVALGVDLLEKVLKQLVDTETAPLAPSELSNLLSPIVS